MGFFSWDNKFPSFRAFYRQKCFNVTLRLHQSKPSTAAAHALNDAEELQFITYWYKRGNRAAEQFRADWK